MTPAFRWAVVGLVLILGSAVHRLGRRGIEAIDSGLTPSEWLALVLLTATFVVGEGYYAIARKWVPRVLGRAAALRTEPRLVPRLLAPLHAMGLVYVSWPTALRNWAGVAAIVAAVLIIRAFPDPWRGIVDFAVAGALVVGVVALLGHARQYAD